MTFDDFLAMVESAIVRDTGRGVEALAPAAQGDLGRAARSLVSAERATVVIVTGFLIPLVEGAVAETDGPPGTAVLAAACRSVGAEVVVVTDEPCSDVVSAAVAGFGGLEDVAIRTVRAAPLAEAESDVASLAVDLSSLGATHVVFVERPGPTEDGSYRSMRGIRLADVAPLERLSELTGAHIIGIGDGGNEVGMGKLPRTLIEANVEHGSEVASVTGCDSLIVSAVSNWGACALASAVLVLAEHGERRDLTPLNVTSHLSSLQSALAAGAVDGVTGEQTESVDGLEWSIYQQVLVAIATLAELCE